MQKIEIGGTFFNKGLFYKCKREGEEIKKLIVFHYFIRWSIEYSITTFKIRMYNLGIENEKIRGGIGNFICYGLVAVYFPL